MLIPPCWFEKRASETEEQIHTKKVISLGRGHAYLNENKRTSHGGPRVMKERIDENHLWVTDVGAGQSGTNSEIKQKVPI